ncbi:hypothetical protein [Spongiibacter sp. UBA1325]|uniref:hypothetical protein n=1 Tax=Spongiibacter sp. UBA1325 TaxID=1947543 RepID=UPI00257E4987|nr:hypothetical protein [Spongiibacter sp. UBA1325]|tara:strand:+ start:11214 stop:11573 length:360 start_codon:yes stop_codon:yes gene_type:complete
MKYLIHIFLFLVSNFVLAADYYEVKSEEIEAKWEKVSKERYVFEDMFYSKVFVPNEGTYWLVKPRLKGVYPALWRRWVIDTKNGQKLQMEGWYAGDEKEFLKFFGADLAPNDPPTKKGS